MGYSFFCSKYRAEGVRAAPSNLYKRHINPSRRVGRPPSPTEYIFSLDLSAVFKTTDTDKNLAMKLSVRMHKVAFTGEQIRIGLGISCHFKTLEGCIGTCECFKFKSKCGQQPNGQVVSCLDLPTNR